MTNLYIKKTAMTLLIALSTVMIPAGPALAADTSSQTAQSVGNTSGSGQTANPTGTTASAQTANVAGTPSSTQTANQTGNTSSAPATGSSADQGQGKSDKKKASAKKKKISIKLSRKNLILNKDKSKQLILSVKNVSKKKVVWSSNRNQIVTVNKNGKITARQKGTAVITARVKGTNVKATCKVEVQNYKIMRMRTTGYCNCRRCAGKWAGHATASGKMPKANHTIAVDRRLIKLGTKVQIGNIIYTAEDTGGAIKGKRIDVYYKSHRQASRHGVKYEMVKVFY